MGALLAYPESLAISEDVYTVFKKKGFNVPTKLKFGSTIVELFPKQLVQKPQIEKIGDSYIVASGTCFYRGKGIDTGLRSILADYMENKCNGLNIAGEYLIFIYHQKKLSFYTDNASLYNVFYDKKTNIISTSFLALVASSYSLRGKVKVNKNAVSEVLTTGNLIGPETLIDGIERYESKIQDKLAYINKAKINTSPINKEGANKADELTFQFDQLKSYFNDLSAYFNELGALSGLTGGFDSRLIYYLLDYSTKNHCQYTTFRAHVNADSHIATRFARKMGIDLKSPRHVSPLDMEPNKLQNLIEENFFFNDGLIRTYQIWLEEIKSPKYHAQLLDNKKILISGIGGEQYRNSESLLASKYSIMQWFYYELVYKYSGNPFNSKKSKEELLTYITNKIKRLLLIDKHCKHIEFGQIKAYYNEIFNPANRATRNNIENQLAYFLSPFADYKLSTLAYRVIPYLGKSHRIEVELLKKLAPEQDDIPTSYGYALKEKIPARYALNSLAKNALGLKYYNQLYYWAKQKKQVGNKSLYEKHSFLIQYKEAVEKLKLPVDIDVIDNSNFLSPLVIQMGIFLKQFDKFIQYD